MGDDVLERLKRQDEARRYYFASMQAQQVVRDITISKSISREEVTAKDICRGLYRGWQKTERDSPEEKAYEDIMGPYEKTLKKQKLLE